LVVIDRFLKVTFTLLEADRPSLVRYDTRTLTFNVLRFFNSFLPRALNATRTEYLPAFEGEIDARRIRAPATDTRPAPGTRTRTLAAEPTTAFNFETRTEALAARDGTLPRLTNPTEPIADNPGPAAGP
jgi:hypothetical protein